MRGSILLFALLGAPVVAHAGLGSLLKAAAKVGATAGKAGAKGAKLAKGGAALKGASILGTTVAAERVFLHTADDVGRVGMFVAADADGALKVVMRGGDEATHSVDSLKGLVSDLDEMAKVADDVGDNTRLLLANTDGPSWSVASTEAAPLVLERARDLGDRLVLSGPGVVAVHAVAPEATIELVADAPADDLPEWAKAALGGLVLVGFLGIKLALASRKREA